MNNKVVLVGAGPGDVDLITLRGKEYISKAECIIYDRLASKDILKFAKSDCEMIFVGKENHRHVMKQDKINELLVKKAGEYKLVVRLKGGDPYVFGRGGEEAIFLQQHGIETEVISGVTSAISVLASAGIPITHRGVAKGFQVITAHSRNDELSDINFGQLLDESVTLVFLMGFSHVGRIAEELIKAGRDENTPIAVISKGTTAKQKKCIGSLCNINELVKNSNLESPAIIVVGNVVKLQNDLSFFEKRALFGKNILVPYIEGFRYSVKEGIIDFKENRLTKSLREKGANVTNVRVGKIMPSKITDIADVKECRWLIFTSANGIYSFMFNLFEAGYDTRILSGCKIAVVGKKTAECIKEFSLCADLISENQTAEGLFEELKEVVCKDDKILYFSAKEVEIDLEKLLNNYCSIKRIVAYENVIIKEDCEGYFDFICFTSASTVERTLQRLNTITGTVVSIGPSCSRALREKGITNYIQSSEPNYECMVEAIIESI